MPLLNIYSPVEKTTIGIWKITEEPDELILQSKPDSQQLERCLTWKNRLRQKQWLAVRALYAHVTGSDSSEVSYMADGKPFVKNSATAISISHTDHYALVALSENGPCGIDAETYHPRIRKIAKRFLNNDELRYSGERDSLVALYYYWCGKEALFKVHPRPVEDFRNSIHIHSIDYLCKNKGIGTGTVRESRKSYKYRLFPIVYNEILVVFACE